MATLNDLEIENFSCWSYVLHGDVLDLGLLLKLYPRGKGGRDQYLVVRITEPWIPSELSFIGSDGSIICTRRHDAGSKEKIFFTGPKFEEVVAGIRGNEPFHKDRLILRWKTPNLKKSVRYRTVIDASSVFFQIKPEIFNSNAWNNISDYYNYREEGGEHIVLKACKTGSTLEDAKVKFKFESSTNSEILAQTSMWMVNDGNIIRKYEDDCIFNKTHSREHSYEIPLKELFEKGLLTIMRCKFISGKLYQNYHYYSDNPLSPGIGITDFLKLCRRESSENTSTFISNPTSESTSFPIERELKPENAVTVLTKDLMYVYQDHDFSDFELRCGTVSFPTHRVILSARSPVFKAMLSGDMREAASGTMDVEDLDPHTLGRFLAFLYSGATGEALQWEEASKLYYAADKYQVSSLKVECSAVLSASVSLANVCDILSLADKHQDEELRSIAHDFFLEKYNEVLKSENWDKFMKSDPLLAVKTVTNITKNKTLK